jgi:hypothetical protein
MHKQDVVEEKKLFFLRKFVKARSKSSKEKKP